MIRNNSRIPDVVAGDLRGQVGATRLGAQRFQALCEEYDLETVLQAMASLIDRTAARVRTEFAAWPDGTFEAEGRLDHDGADTSTPIRFHVRSTKTGEHITLDFSDSDGQTSGPVNVPRATAQSVSLLAVLAASDPTIPMNAGVLDAVAFNMPPGIVMHPQYPATVNSYFPSAHLVYACVLAALGRFNPARAVAPAGLATGAVAIGYAQGRTGKPTVQYELMTTSLGGDSEHDGAAMLLPMNHFTPGTPVEIVETEYPVRISRYDIWPDSAGAGQQRGGIGFIREYEFLTDCTLTVRASNHRYTSWGLFGGQSPRLSRSILQYPDGTSDELDIMATRQVRAGTKLQIEQNGGGGYGNPRDRAAERVVADVRNGYVSVEGAAREYGVRVTVEDRAGILHSF